MGGNHRSPESSCDLGQPNDGKRGMWGCARNRADRVSHYLSDKQVERLMRAAADARGSGRIFQRHWTVHYGLAGIEPNDGVVQLTTQMIWGNAVPRWRELTS